MTATPSLRPRRFPGRAWLGIAVYFLVILASLPLAPLFMRWLRDTSGSEESIGWLAVVVLALAGLWVFVRVVRRLRVAGPATLLWFAAVSAAYGWFLATMDVPAEKVHFVEYGILGLLIFRAYGSGHRDLLTMVGGVVIGYCLGLLDELVQWWSPWYGWWGLPRRNGEIQDALTNLWAVGLAQIVVWRFFDPGMATRAVTPASIRRFTAWAMVAWSGTCLFVAGTSEFGHRFEDPEIGVFYSRLDMETLRRTDAEEGDRYGKILRDHRDTDYGHFVVDLYPPSVDPFLHEVRVHIFRRDRYLRRRNQAIVEPGKTREAHELGVVARREDDILRRYFPRTLAASGYAWTPEERSWADESDAYLGHPPYESAVSNRIITAFSRIHALAAWPVGLAILTLAARGFAGRARTAEQRSGRREGRPVGGGEVVGRSAECRS